MKGKPIHTLTRTIAQNAATGEFNQSTAGRPIPARRVFTAPLSPANIPRQVRAMMYCGMAQGSSSAIRHAVRPRMKSWCSNAASATPRATCNAVQAMVHSTVRLNVVQNPGSLKTSRYWRGPVMRQSRML
ncbi:MAG: hypothetical protein ACKOKC_13240 [Chthoniobacterales bacterium]